MTVSNVLMNLVRSTTPPINPDLARGLATKYVDLAEEYIDQIWRAVNEQLPPGLEYVGCHRCSPRDEFSREGKTKNSRKEIEMARNDLYMMAYNFRLHGKDLPPKYIYLPFLGQAASLHLGGTMGFISPIITDSVLSFESNGIFVKLVRTRFQIQRTMHMYMVNLSRLEQGSVVHSRIYNQSKTRKAGSLAPIYTSMPTTLVHYLLCRYGFTEMFERFAKVVPVVGGHEINPENYPLDKWLIFSSHGFRPRTLSKSQDYEPSQVRLAVRIEDDSTLLRSLVASFYAIVDNFPMHTTNPQDYDEVRLWKVLMGYILFRTQAEGKLHDETENHINSISEYIDQIMVARFRKIGFEIKDIFEFFALVVENYSNWMNDPKNKHRANSLYNKEMATVTEMLHPLVKSIFMFHYHLKLEIKRHGSLTEQIITDLLKRSMTREIFKIIKPEEFSGLSNVSYSGDNMCMKITSDLVATRNKRGAAEADSLENNSQKLHVSYAEVSNYINISQSNHIGIGRLNHHLILDEEARVVRNPELMELLDNTQALIDKD